MLQLKMDCVYTRQNWHVPVGIQALLRDWPPNSQDLNPIEMF
jgi:hypothetical protein